jgi:aspartyl-tRNA(Asn)/glutamyl-tRNA(Gln) amidotransferase subunit B
MEARGGSPEEVVPIIRRFASGEITDTECALEIKCTMTGESAKAAAAASGDLEKIVSEYLDQNPGIVADYAKNDKAANKAIGYVMKQSGGRFSSAEVVEAVRKAIESRMRGLV